LDLALSFFSNSSIPSNSLFLYFSYVIFFLNPSALWAILFLVSRHFVVFFSLRSVFIISLIIGQEPNDFSISDMRGIFFCSYLNNLISFGAFPTRKNYIKI